MITTHLPQNGKHTGTKHKSHCGHTQNRATTVEIPITKAQLADLMDGHTAQIRLCGDCVEAKIEQIEQREQDALTNDAAIYALHKAFQAHGNDDDVARDEKINEITTPKT